VAYWGLRSGTGQRDLWTVAADGSEAVRGGTPVTDDLALDWSPAWSPDGRFLFFASTRGGTMNLWRVAIDERSGRVMGDPEPVTTPSSWSGSLSFSRDGTKLAYASLDWRSTLFRASFDPDRGVLAGTPAPVFKNTRPIRDHELSPDGQWVAYVETGAQDDLLVARIDASEYRRLTDDPFRDRGPAWSPDQKRIVFYSDRSGVYQLWTVRPEGSAPEQLVDVPGANFSTWSPDGNRIAFSGVTAGGWFIVDSASKAARPAAPEPSADAATRFWPFSWSRDGSRVAGIVVRPDGASGSTAVYSLASRTFAVVPDTAGHVWQVPVWLPDSRRLIVRDEHGVWLVTPETGARRLLIPVRGYVLGRSVGTSRDGRWITYTETATEGDIWLATLGKS
jgi:Tol biopolymer transport system component